MNPAGRDSWLEHESSSWGQTDRERQSTYVVILKLESVSQFGTKSLWVYSCLH